MKTMTVRNIPDDLYEDLKRLARRNRRSIQQQTLVLLQRARLLAGPDPVREAARIRESLCGRDLGDVVADVREERDR